MLIQFTNVRSSLVRSSLIAGACLMLAACRGGLSLPSAVPITADSAVSAHSMSKHAGIPVTVNLVVPVGKAALLRNLGDRSPFFVAFQTKGAKVVAFAHGDRTTPLGTVVANVAAGSSVCTQSAARVCALALSVHATGKDDFVITTYDQSPSGGVIPPGAHQLAAGVEVAKIESKGKTLNAVVGGVVASTSLYLSLGAVSSIDATNFSAIVVARDTDGNAIVTDKYESATGTKVKVTLSSSASGGTSFRFHPATITTAARGLAVTVSYKPSGVTGAQVQAGFSTVLSATANNGATVGTATFAALAPQITELLRQPRLVGRPLWPLAATARSGSRSSALIKSRGFQPMRRAVRKLPEFLIPTAASHPFDLTSGPDGQVWFTEDTGNKIGHIPVTATSGSDISEVALPTLGSSPSCITAGSDNALYFTELTGNRVGRIPTNATSTSAITEITLPVAGSGPQAWERCGWQHLVHRTGYWHEQRRSHARWCHVGIANNVDYNFLPRPVSRNGLHQGLQVR